MAKLQWDAVGTRLYETGTSHGVIALMDATGRYGKPVAWTGLTKVTEAPDGAEETVKYADDIKYLSLMSAENFKGTVGAFTYPNEFAQANGEVELAPGFTMSQQSRKPFGMSYRTILGNDTETTDHGYKIHFVYGAKVQPTEKEYATVNEDPDANEMEWDFVTTPVDVPGHKPSSSFVVDSTVVPPAKLKLVEDMIYGTDQAEAKFPTPAELIAILQGPATTGK